MKEFGKVIVVECFVWWLVWMKLFNLVIFEVWVGLREWERVVKLFFILFVFCLYFGLFRFIIRFFGY